MYVSFFALASDSAKILCGSSLFLSVVKLFYWNPINNSNSLDGTRGCAAVYALDDNQTAHMNIRTSIRPRLSWELWCRLVMKAAAAKKSPHAFLLEIIEAALAERLDVDRA